MRVAGESSSIESEGRAWLSRPASVLAITSALRLAKVFVYLKTLINSRSIGFIVSPGALAHQAAHPGFYAPGMPPDV